MHGRRLSMERARSGQRAAGSGQSSARWRTGAAGAQVLFLPTVFLSLTTIICWQHAVMHARCTCAHRHVCAWRTAAVQTATLAGCVCACGIECKQCVRVCSCTATLAAKGRAGHGVPCSRAWRWLQPGARGCGWPASDQAAARAISSTLSRHFGGNAPAHGSAHHVSCSGAGGTNTRGWGAHKIRECPGSGRVVRRRGVLGQVVHLRAWPQKPCLTGCLHTRAETRSCNANAEIF